MATGWMCCNCHMPLAATLAPCPARPAKLSNSWRRRYPTRFHVLHLYIHARSQFQSLSLTFDCSCSKSSARSRLLGQQATWPPSHRATEPLRPKRSLAFAENLPSRLHLLHFAARSCCAAVNVAAVRVHFEVWVKSCAFCGACLGVLCWIRWEGGYQFRKNPHLAMASWTLNGQGKLGSTGILREFWNNFFVNPTHVFLLLNLLAIQSLNMETPLAKYFP